MCSASFRIFICRAARLRTDYLARSFLLLSVVLSAMLATSPNKEKMISLGVTESSMYDSNSYSSRSREDAPMHIVFGMLQCISYRIRFRCNVGTFNANDSLHGEAS